MINKPSLFSIKYDNMDKNETLLNYERDMMLWEQTEALNKLANKTNYNTDYTPIIPYKYLDPTKPRNFKYVTLYHKLDILENTFTPLLITLLFIVICLIPIIEFIISNIELANILKFIILPVTLLSMILVKLNKRHIINKLQSMIKQNKTNKSKVTSQKFNDYNEKSNPKPVKEVLTLKH